MKTMRFLAGPLLILLTILAFWPVFRNGFVWDDQEFIVRNPALRGLWPPARFFISQGSAAEGAIYPVTGQRPVMAFSLALDYALWQRKPWGFHLTNFLLHLLCVAGTWLLVWKTSRSSEAGLLAGLLFAVHPGHAEGVIAFLGRSDLLATLFILLGFWGYVQHRDAEGWRRLLWYFGSLSSFLIACFSKETGLVLLGLLLAYEFFAVGDVKSKIQNPKSRISRLLPFVLAGLFYWIYRGKVLGGQSAGSAWWGGTPYTNFLMMFEVYARYLRLLVFPAQLSPLHTVPVPQGWWDVQVLWGLGLFLGTVVATIGMLRRTPWTGFFLAWFLFGLIPVANLIPIPGVMIMAERWLYLPSLGVCALAGWGAWVVWSRFRGWTRGVWFVLVAVVLFLFIVRTRSWCSVWKTQESVARTIVATSPDSPMGYNNLGNALLAGERYSEAIVAFREALRLNPDYAEAHHNLGLVLDAMGDSLGAGQEYRQALDLNPGFPPAHAAWGAFLIRQGRETEGESELRLSLTLNPRLAEGHNSLGNLLHRQGCLREAESEFRSAVSCNPNYVPAYYNLGNVLLSQSRPLEAEPWFREAIKLKPNLANAYYNLALSLEDQGRLREAARAYEAYLVVVPNALDRPEVEKKIARLSLPSR